MPSELLVLRQEGGRRLRVHLRDERVRLGSDDLGDLRPVGTLAGRQGYVGDQLVPQCGHLGTQRRHRGLRAEVAGEHRGRALEMGGGPVPQGDALQGVGRGDPVEVRVRLVVEVGVADGSEVRHAGGGHDGGGGHRVPLDAESALVQVATQQRQERRPLEFQWLLGGLEVAGEQVVAGANLAVGRRGR